MGRPGRATVLPSRRRARVRPRADSRPSPRPLQPRLKAARPRRSGRTRRQQVSRLSRRPSNKERRPARSKSPRPATNRWTSRPRNRRCLGPKRLAGRRQCSTALRRNGPRRPCHRRGSGYPRPPSSPNRRAPRPASDRAELQAPRPARRGVPRMTCLPPRQAPDRLGQLPSSMRIGWVTISSVRICLARPALSPWMHLPPSCVRGSGRTLRKVTSDLGQGSRRADSRRAGRVVADRARPACSSNGWTRGRC